VTDGPDELSTHEDSSASVNRKVFKRHSLQRVLGRVHIGVRNLSIEEERDSSSAALNRKSDLVVVAI
jgi:hypothetical protein